MFVFCWVAGFKIKSKADVDKFLHMSKGDFYWCDGKMDYILTVFDEKTGKCRVTERPVWMRGNVFNPCMVVPDPKTTMWKTRKYINRELSED